MPEIKLFSLAGLIVGALVLAVPAQAALVKHRATACRSDADLKKPALFDAKTASGDCTVLAPNAVVTIDQKRAGLFCVRPDGALDCLWVSASMIDERGVLTKEAPPPDRPYVLAPFVRDNSPIYRP